MSIEMRFSDFQKEYNLDDDAMAKLMGLFNDTFIDLAHKLLADSKIPSAPVDKKTKTKNTSYPLVKKWATKIAQQYAQENNITLDDFEVDEETNKCKFTKKDIETLLKNRQSSEKTVKKNVKVNTKDTKLDTEPWYSTPRKEKNVSDYGMCCGLNRSGDPCQKQATVKPDTAKKSYCFRHAMDWKDFEVSSDSDDEEDNHSEKNMGTEQLCQVVDSE